MKKLSKYGIETRNFFWPLHQQPVLKKMGLFKKCKLPVSENLAKKSQEAGFGSKANPSTFGSQE